MPYPKKHDIMDFKQLTAKELLDIRDRFDKDYGICDYTFGANYMWYDYFVSGIAYASNGMPIIASGGNKNFSYPIGDGDALAALDELKEYLGGKGKPFVIDRVPRSEVDKVTAYYKGAEAARIEGYWDYVYDIDALSEMTGKKYNGLRNHINKFTREYPDARFRIITEDDLPAVRAFFDEYCADYDKSSDSFAHDNMATRRVLDNFGQLGFIGGAVFAGGKALAFAIGELGDKTDNMLFVHIEKCSRTVPSVSKFLVREFARMGRGLGAKFVNRAEDMGDQGIRYSKEQYNPCRLEYKYRIVVS